MKPLYEIVQAHRELTKLAEAEEFDPQAVADTLEGLEGDISVKARSVAAVVLSVEAWAQAAEDAAKRIQERAASTRKRAAWLRNYLQTNMQAAGMSKIEHPDLTVSIRKNPAAVQIADGIILPARFMVQPEPPPPRPDKKAIADALKAGEQIEGCQLVQSERLEIR